MDEKIKHIVRIANADLIGKKAIVVALTKIKGVGHLYSNMICKLASINVHKKAGLLDNREIDKLNNVLSDPKTFKVPSWMMNRRSDYQTGQDLHFTGGDLMFSQEQDIRRLKKIKSYRGFRHAARLPVRGQRTKSNFRKNKGKAVGVRRRSGAKAGRV